MPTSWTTIAKPISSVWTNIAKPISSTYTTIAKPTNAETTNQAGAYMGPLGLTYFEDTIVGSPWTNINKPT